MGSHPTTVARVATVSILVVAAGTAHADVQSTPLSLSSCDVLGARAGEVKALYWELYDHTEVCVNLPSAPGPPGAWPLSFTFSFTYTGRTMKAPPANVLFRVMMPPYAAIAWPSLQVTLDSGERLDLTAPGRPYRVVYPPGCVGAEDGCGCTGLEVPLSREEFLRWAAAKTISGTAFGVDFSLAPGAHESLLSLAERLEPAP
jgi:hypothetical protein